MDAIKRWVLAVIGRSEMGAIEAGVLIVTGGGVWLTIILAPIAPKPSDPVYVWGIYWLVIVMSLGLLLRGAFAIVQIGLRGSAGPAQWLRERLPFEVQAPLVRKVPSVSPRPPGAKGIFDYEADADNATKRMGKLLTGLDRETRSIGDTLGRSTPRIPKLANVSPETRRRELRSIGDRINKHAAKMEHLQALFRPEIDIMSENSLKRLPHYGPEAKAVWRAAYISLRDKTAGARPSTVGMRDAVLGLRNQAGGEGIQQSVNDATDRLAEVLRRLISDFDAITRFTTAALRVIDGPAPVAGRRSRRRT
ncbi:MAG TPA: hypothetical protein VGQ85_04635 [Candidatus Limnocylindrales bacterium]|nr:hypothetical protein [Candidatus Limnocylindrales bacterium]